MSYVQTEIRRAIKLIHAGDFGGAYILLEALDLRIEATKRPAPQMREWMTQEYECDFKEEAP